MKTLLQKSEKNNSQYLKNTLQGAQYPIAKSQMIEVAELNFADGDILDVLYALGDSNYYSLADVQGEIQNLLHDERVSLNEGLMFDAELNDEDVDVDDDDDANLDTNDSDDKIDGFILAYL